MNTAVDKVGVIYEEYVVFVHESLNLSTGLRKPHSC